MQPVNVLITAASRRVGLIRAFSRALRNLKNPGQIITTDMNPFSPGLYFSSRHYMVPLTTHPNYIPTIKSICVHESISLLIPTIDDEIPIFGAHRAEFAQIGTRVACCSAEHATICNDKYATYVFLKEKGFPVAETYLPEKGLPRTFPLFIKPRFGRGSIGAHPISNERELAFFLHYVQDPVVQEYLTGREFTIDVCCDFEGHVLEVVPRERLVIRAGVSDRGITVKHPALMDIGERVATALEIVGVINVQVKMEEHSAKIFEINPRYAGGIPLTIAAGADFPNWQVRMVMKRKIKPRIGTFRDGLIMACFEDALFLSQEQIKEKSLVNDPLKTKRSYESIRVQ